MRIVASDFMSLDGVVQASGQPDEDTDGDFAHGGWSMPFLDPDAMGSVIGEAMELPARPGVTLRAARVGS
jgi:hypothetical protein